MDLLKDAAKNLSLYDVKAYVRKAQNVAMNLSEMEAKVREATNNEPWGAPSTLMSQIAAGTFNYREREEIIGLIFRRFTEKAANEWRQIYKSLQLLDYLIKNGSERIIDDVRANLTLIQMLKSFHYIDSKGRDQGINVRNRAKNLIAFLNDDAQIRAERKKSKGNANKFGGVSSAAYGGASSITQNGGGYEDSDFTNRVYGDGGVYGERYGDSAAGYSNGQTGASNNAEYEEYDVSPTPQSAAANAAASRATTSASKVTAQPKKDILEDLLSFDGPSSSAAAPAPAAADDDEDDFDDFQAAPSQPQKPTNTTNFANLYNQGPQRQQTQPAVPSYGNTAPHVNYNTSSALNNTSTFNNTSGPAKASSSDAFSSLFSSAKSKTNDAKVNAAPAAPAAPASVSHSANDDFFGDFSSNATAKAAPTKSSNNGEIDLLSF